MKAMFFQDYGTAVDILDAKTPNEARLLGRKVKNYDDKKWSEVRYKIFYDLNLIKYTIDKKLQERLLDPKFDNKVFVEASPIDRIWGVGTRGKRFTPSVAAPVSFQISCPCKG